MKVVAKQTIKMSIDSYIDDLQKEGVEILRIELSLDEFVEMWKSRAVRTDYNIHWRHGLPSTGSYLIYRDICVQHHEDYRSGDFGVEYI